MKNQLIGKDLYVRKDWREEEEGLTEDEMVGWHHILYGHELEKALGVGSGQGNHDLTDKFTSSKLCSIQMIS